MASPSYNASANVPTNVLHGPSSSAAPEVQPDGSLSSLLHAVRQSSQPPLLTNHWLSSHSQPRRWQAPPIPSSTASMASSATFAPAIPYNGDASLATSCLPSQQPRYQQVPVGPSSFYPEAAIPGQLPHISGPHQGTPFCSTHAGSVGNVGSGFTGGFRLPDPETRAFCHVPAPAEALPLHPRPHAQLPDFFGGPGGPLVAGKTVASIVAGEFIELSALLEENAAPAASELAISGGALIVRPRQKKREVADIATWMEAFNIFMSVLTAYHPHRTTDLLRYSLLILRSARRFPGFGWRAYDRAYRQQAAASRLTDWSALNAELFHFHVASSDRPPLPLPAASSRATESAGSPSSNVICRSWNSGRCSSVYPRCRFRHCCDVPQCGGLHRRQSHFTQSRGLQKRFPNRLDSSV